MSENDFQGLRIARIPGNVDAPDRVVMGLTARQAGILTATAVVLYGLFQASRPLLSPLVFGPLAVLVLVIVTVAVTVNRDGLSLDLLGVAALRHLRSPKRQVLAPEGVEAPPRFVAEAMSGSPTSPAPYLSPVRQVGADGIVDLGRDGASALARCSTVNFALRTGAEQEILIGGFGRWLNALTGPTQICRTSRPVELAERSIRLRATAPSLPHPALEAAACEHADFLESLADYGRLLDRDVLLAAHEVAPEPGPRLGRRVADAAGQLAACEVTTTPLDAAWTAVAIQSAFNPRLRAEEGS
ncbi:PrgI family protein [Catenulispora pinisilvae]|uniref:PrgI family protein n=1 Tax=Catenulispora pinisilvae TaxID=2705253 RepID=UPI00189180DB|nr:PrgI family protein [Catenulispora pinisilvae]